LIVLNLAIWAGNVGGNTVSSGLVEDSWSNAGWWLIHTDSLIVLNLASWAGSVDVLTLSRGSVVNSWSSASWWRWWLADIAYLNLAIWAGSVVGLALSSGVVVDSWGSAGWSIDTVAVLILVLSDWALSGGVLTHASGSVAGGSGWALWVGVWLTLSIDLGLSLWAGNVGALAHLGHVVVGETLVASWSRDTLSILEVLSSWADDDSVLTLLLSWVPCGAIWANWWRWSDTDVVLLNLTSWASVSDVLALVGLVVEGEASWAWSIDTLSVVEVLSDWALSDSLLALSSGLVVSLVSSASWWRWADTDSLSVLGLTVWANIGDLLAHLGGIVVGEASWASGSINTLSVLEDLASWADTSGGLAKS